MINSRFVGENSPNCPKRQPGLHFYPEKYLSPAKSQIEELEDSKELQLKLSPAGVILPNNQKKKSKIDVLDYELARKFEPEEAL